MTAEDRDGEQPARGGWGVRPRPGDAGWLAAYVGCGLLATWIQRGAGPSLWVPSVAVGIGWLLRRGRGAWPFVLLSAVVVELFGRGMHPLPALLAAAITTLECAIAAALLVGLRRSKVVSLDSTLVIATALACIFATLIGASLATLLARATHAAGDAAIQQRWLTRWAGDGISAITLLPAVRLWASPRFAATHAARSRTFAETFALYALTVMVGLRHLLGRESGIAEFVPGLVMATLPLLWAALRFDRRATALVVAVLSVTSVVALRLQPLAGTGTSAGLHPQLLELQINLGVLAIAMLALSRVIEHEHDARHELQDLAASLKFQATHHQLAQAAGRTGSWEAGPDGADVWWSSETFALLGLDPEKVAPTVELWQSLRHPEFAGEVSLVVLIRAGAQRIQREMLMRLPDGRDVWFELRGERVTLSGRTRVVGTITDTSERHRRQSEVEHLASILASASEAILSVDGEGRVRTWNPAAARIFGVAEAGAGARSFFDFVPEDRRDEERVRLRRAFEGERVPAEHVEMEAGDGRRLPVRVSFAPVLESRGRVTEVAIVCSDLTEQRHLEQQLVQAQKMEAVGRLSGGIAHDFNNMLTAILGFSELVRSRLGSDPEAAADIEQVIHAAERAAALTQRLLAFSRRQPRAPQRIEIDGLLEKLSPMLRRLIGEDVQLHLRCAAANGVVLADPTQIEQVLLNLIVNSRDAMGPGGTVAIETALVRVDDEMRRREPELPPGHSLVLAVSDNGHGMDAATRARIFEPFFTTKEAGRGTGLGLSTVHAIVRENDGAVRVESEPGLGTTFRIYLPLLSGEDGEPDAIAPELPAPGGSERILLVEDELLVREFLRACLEASGYQVKLATSGEQALEFLEVDRETPDLLVTDIVLPRTNGIEVAQRGRACCPGLPVLLLSGYSEALFSGPLPGELLGKPFSRESLLHAVRRALDGVPRMGDRTTPA